MTSRRSSTSELDFTESHDESQSHQTAAKNNDDNCYNQISIIRNSPSFVSIVDEIWCVPRFVNNCTLVPVNVKHGYGRWGFDC